MAKAAAPVVIPDPASYKYWLAKRSLTQRALGLKIGVAEGTLSHAFRGRRPMPLELAKAVARGLDISVEQIVESGS